MTRLPQKCFHTRWMRADQTSMMARHSEYGIFARAAFHSDYLRLCMTLIGANRISPLLSWDV
jgi:hypothetical protein